MSAQHNQLEEQYAAVIAAAAATVAAAVATATMPPITCLTQKTIGQKDIHGIPVSHPFSSISYKYQSILFTFGQNENTFQSKHVCVCK